MITKIDRLARSALDLLTIVRQLENEGVALKVLDQAIDTGNDSGIEAVPGDARERVGMPRRHLRVAG